jgi:hypothetical protein
VALGAVPPVLSRAAIIIAAAIGARTAVASRRLFRLPAVVAGTTVVTRSPVLS